MENNNSNNPALDILGFLDQTIDTYVEKQFIEACEKTGDEMAIALVNLFIEYGIRGRHLLELIHKLQMICDIAKSEKKEDEDDG